jgi:UDP-N-acetylmuramyl pentapeptide synthase
MNFRSIAAGAREENVNDVRFFDNSDAAATAILDELREGDLVLIKGSRGVATDKIVAAIRERFPLAGEESKGSN